VKSRLFEASFLGTRTYPFNAGACGETKGEGKGEKVREKVERTLKDECV